MINLKPDLRASRATRRDYDGALEVTGLQVFVGDGRGVFQLKPEGTLSPSGCRSIGASL